MQIQEKNERNLSVLQDLALFSGYSSVINNGSIQISNKMLENSSKSEMIKNTHDVLQDFYCLSVPGKAFFIKDGDKISVTGNSLHCESMIKLFRIFIKENRDIWDDELKQEIYAIAEHTVELEDSFIDLAFEQGGIEGLEPCDVKKYIRYIADRRLIELGMKSIFHQRTNPLDWVDHILNGAEHANFFETRATEYSRAATEGDWEDAWNIHDPK